MIKLIRNRNVKFIVFLLVCISVMLFGYIRMLYSLPGNLTLLEGEEYVYDFRSLFCVDMMPDKNGIISLTSMESKTTGGHYQLEEPLTIKSEKNGFVNINLKLFGLLPVRTIHVDVVPNKMVVACGNTIGVKLNINGILVIGISDVNTKDGRNPQPGKEVGIRPGDFLIAINGKKLDTIEELISEVDKSGGNPLKIKYRRGSTFIDTEIKPVLSNEDKKYHIGLWVRDSSAGIGTITFYDPETKRFGALGHGIADIDTGTILPVESGEVIKSTIMDIRKGKTGSPGELKGMFLDGKKLGYITNNCESGIYGILNSNATGMLKGKEYPMAMRSQVKEGPASILCNIDGEKVEEYGIEIQRVILQNSSSSKGMVIKITDKRLLDKTGGIVQGMSGSPIIQNGRIVGAVTHVLVNDPTRGYGIFMEWMYKNIMGNKNLNIAAAG
ncbi:MAG: SpoIVB peptidase [Bacillota bacterium]|nr:SpoIVB peptidase [Bacillota bacterium]